MELYLSFSEILRFFKRHLWKFAVLTLACGVLLGVLSLKSFQRVYSATSTILVACTIDDNASPDYSNQYASMLNVRLQAAIAMAELEDFRVAVAERAGVEESSLSGITASQVSTSTLVDLTISTGDRDHAAALADAAAEEMADQLEAIYPTPPIQVHVTNHAETPAEQSARSSVMKSGILGIVLGIILSLCIGLAVLLLDHTMRDGTYVSNSLKLPFLGALSAKAGEQRRQDEFRALRASVFQQTKGHGSVLFTPVHTKKGAGRTAAGLAKAMTLTGKTVLLVEADFSGNALSAQLDAGASQGLAAILEGTTSLKEAAVPTGTKGLSFLPCGKAFGNSADLVASRAFSEFLYDAAEQYDYVFCVLPGEEEMPDADNAAPAASAVVLVAEYGKTPFRNFEKSLDRLRTAGGNISGFVMTNVY